MTDAGGRQLDAALHAGCRVAADGTVRAEGAFAGAALAVHFRGEPVHASAYGWAWSHDAGVTLPEPIAVDTGTAFDVASVTKLAATALLVMSAVERGELVLTDPLRRWLPVLDEARDTRLGSVTIEQVLVHRGGLPPWEPLYLHAQGPAEALERIAALQLAADPGQQVRYSDLGMMLLGAVLEVALGCSLPEAFQARVAGPLGLERTGYHGVGVDRPVPTRPTDGSVAATSTGNPAEQRMIMTGEPYPVAGAVEDFAGWRHHTLVGEVNDGNAHHAFGGAAGHAGLFSTAGELATIGQWLLDTSLGVDRAIASPDVVRRFTGGSDREPLGMWSGRLTQASIAGPPGLGHRGFTGCELVFDPTRRLVVAFVSNRQHPDYPYPSVAGTVDAILRTSVASWQG